MGKSICHIHNERPDALWSIAHFCISFTIAETHFNRILDCCDIALPLGGLRFLTRCMSTKTCWVTQRLIAPLLAQKRMHLDEVNIEHFQSCGNQKSIVSPVFTPHLLRTNNIGNTNGCGRTSTRRCLQNMCQHFNHNKYYLTQMAYSYENIHLVMTSEHRMISKEMNLRIHWSWWLQTMRIFFFEQLVMKLRYTMWPLDRPGRTTVEVFFLRWRRKYTVYAGLIQFDMYVSMCGIFTICRTKQMCP